MRTDASGGVDPAAHRRALLAVLVVSTLVRGAAAFGVPILDDEAHYWVWSRHLMWGYPDHPPMIAGLVAASTRVLGDAVLAIRFFPVLLGTASTAVIYALARRLFGPSAGLRAAVLFQVLPAFAASGVMAAPDAPLGFFWLLAMLLAWRATRGERWAWPAVGAAVGLVIQCKLAGGAIALSLAGFVLATPSQRRWLGTPGPYLALAAGAVVLAPLVWWNLAYGWATVARALVIDPWTTPSSPAVNVAVYAASQLVYYAPLGFPVLVAALAGAARRARDDERFRFLLWCAAPTLVMVLLGSLRALAKPHYTGPALLAAVVAASGLWEAWRPRRLLRGAVATSAALTLAVLALGAVPTPPLRVFHEEARSWPRVAEEVERLLRAQGDEGTVFVLAETYQTGSQLIYALRNRAPVVVPFRGFDLWEPPERWLGRGGVYMRHPSAGPRDRLPHAFERMDPPAVVPIVPGREVLLYPGVGFRGLR